MNSIEGTTNDLRVAPPSEYITSVSNLPVAGRHPFVIKEFEQITNRDGVPQNAVEIAVELQDAEPGKPRFCRGLRFYGSVYLRDGIPVSGLGDLMTAIDPTEDWSADGMEGALRLLQKAVDRQTVCRGRFDWESFDKDGFLAAGGEYKDKSPEGKALRKAYTVRGMRKHRQLPNGGYYPEVDFVDPQSGETRTLQAKLLMEPINRKEWER